MVETDIRFPTDVSLLWDAMRGLLRTTGRAAGKHGVRGWRQWRHLSREVQTRFHRVRTTRRARAHPERVAAYLERCRALVARAETTLGELAAVAPLTGLQIEGYLAHARRQIDQVERRLLRGETIPHDEKVFSIFEDHTRWISKGKAGPPVELGVPVCVLEDQHGFLLHHEILWEGGDTDIAVPMIEATRRATRISARAASTAVSTAPPTASTSTPCSITTCCPGRGARAGPTASARRTPRSSRRAGSTRRSNPRSTTWSTAASTGCGPTARTASPGSWPSPYWPSTSIASGCCCGAGRRAGRDDEPPPDGAVDGPTGLNPPPGGTVLQAPTAARLATSAYRSPNP